MSHPNYRNNGNGKNSNPFTQDQKSKEEPWSGVMATLIFSVFACPIIGGGFLYAGVAAFHALGGAAAGAAAFTGLLAVGIGAAVAVSIKAAKYHANSGDKERGDKEQSVPNQRQSEQQSPTHTEQQSPTHAGQQSPTHAGQSSSYKPIPIPHGLTAKSNVGGAIQIDNDNKYKTSSGS